MVGSTTVQHDVLGHFAFDSDLPCADLELLAVVHSTPQYAVIESRITPPGHIDSWQDGDLHFFVFPLVPGKPTKRRPEEYPLAVFAIDSNSRHLMSAIEVEPTPSGLQARITDLGASVGM